MTHYTAIAAISENRAIWKNGKIPWYIPEDFTHFKDTTQGHPIIMWRKTYESIWRPLPRRENIVLTRWVFQTPGVTVMHSMEELIGYLSSDTGVYICWWSEIYRLFFDLWRVDEVILSRIHMTIDDADAFFPEFESDFRLDRVDHREGFDIEYWIKKSL